MTVLYRCNHNECRKRVTLAKLRELYVSVPRCTCGGNLHRDTWQRKINKRNACRCSGPVNGEGNAYPHNTHHAGCLNYTGTRDFQHESMIQELGAETLIQHDDGTVPF
jgi:hypothetical protein